jgi:hypothetical protein
LIMQRWKTWKNYTKTLLPSTWAVLSQMHSKNSQSKCNNPQYVSSTITGQVCLTKECYWYTVTE